MAIAELVAALNAVSGAKNYRDWFFGKVEPFLGQAVIDIGSGLGDFADLFARNQARKVILSDASSTMTTKLRKRLNAFPNIETVQLDISDDNSVQAFAENADIDTVTCLNVLEHLEDDVQALRNMRKLVSQKGTIILFVPAMEFLYGSLDRMAGHFRRYTKEKLRFRLEEAGWRVSHIEYFNFFGIMTWFLAGRVFRQKQLNSNACKGLDKLVPFLSSIEKVFKPGIGQSLIAIAQNG